MRELLHTRAKGVSAIAEKSTVLPVEIPNGRGSERLVANYLPWLTAGMLEPTPRKRRMVSMNLGTEIGLDR
jgi:hypothetical protein